MAKRAKQKTKSARPINLREIQLAEQRRALKRQNRLARESDALLRKVERAVTALDVSLLQFANWINARHERIALSGSPGVEHERESVTS